VLNVTLSPVSALGRLAPGTATLGASDTVTDPDVAPADVRWFASVAVTVTVYVPVAVGTQLRLDVVDAVHPSPEPYVHPKVRVPDPPFPVVVNVTVCPTSALDRLASGTCTVGSVNTCRFTDVFDGDVTPFESVTETCTV